MSKYLKYCETCQKLHLPEWFTDETWGYQFWLDDNASVCEQGHPVIDLNVTSDDYGIWIQISRDINFINAMIKLHDEDIVEYELKMSKLRTQAKQLEVERIAEKDKNKIKCPTCNSTNIKKISTTSKAVNTALFGIFGNKRKMQFRCNSCGYEW